MDNKKIARVRIVKTGQCQWRLPTEGRTIRRLQFFTANRIVLAGFAENGDILLWELINKMVDGEERGRWEVIEIVHENPLSPVECAVPEDKKTFISAYSDGSVLIRGFEKGAQIAEALGELEEEIGWIVEIAEKYAPEYDERQILQEVMQRRAPHVM